MRSSYINKIVSIGFLIIIGSYTVLTMNNIDFGNLLFESNHIENYNKYLKDLINNIEVIQNENIYNKNDFVEINGFVQRLLNKQVIEDVDSSKTIIKDNNGFLHFYPQDKRIIINNQVRNIIDLVQFCEDRGMNFLFVQPPSKISTDKNQMPIGIIDYSNEIADELTNNLSEANVDVLDLRDSMSEENLDYKEIFYITDHHWTIEAGFWAFAKITNKLQEIYGSIFGDISTYLDVKNYDKEIFEDNFVGSQGKRVGKYYADIDDTKLFIPKFENHLTWRIYNTAGTQVNKRDGHFYKSLVNVETMESDDIYESKYESLLDTNYETRIVNNLINNDIKVLFIKDSFAKPVAAYTSLIAKETRLLDLRYFVGSTYDYIEEYSPDIVIMLYNTGAIGSEEFFDFYN